MSDVEAGNESSDLDAKGRRGLFGALQKLRGHLYRRREDVLGVSTLGAWVVFDYVYIVWDLAQPPDQLSTSIWQALATVLLLLYLASWFSISFHGPGRVPTVRSAVAMPSTLAAALKAGHECRSAPFGDESWCHSCNQWKPALAHHCRICNKCSVWMDHHCIFAGQCVGFRNLRCYLLWLFYGKMIVIFGAILATVHFITVQTLPSTWWERLALLVWFAASCRSYLFIQEFDLAKWRHIYHGWPSSVLRKKFYNIVDEVAPRKQEVRALCASSSVVESEEIEAAERQLDTASADVFTPENALRGVFAGHDVNSSATLWAGEPPSWRWLIPLLGGGQGDPLCPEGLYDAKACETWSALAAALQCHAALGQRIRDASEEFSQRMLAMSERQPM